MARRIVSAVLLVVLVLVLAAMASAAPATTQANWRVYFRATDTDIGNSLGYMTVGVYAGSSSSTDGYGIDGPGSDAQDARAQLTTATQRAVVGVFDSKAWIRDVKSNRLPRDPVYNAGQAVGPGNPEGSEVFGAYPWEAHQKIWDLRVAGLGSASTLSTILTIKFVGTAAGLPPTQLPIYGSDPAILKPAYYYLRMVDNRNVAGAPANGTVWTIAVPTWQAAAFFSLTLPTFNITTAKDEGALLAQGYKMQFYQAVVPEPSSLLALAGGIMGLAGYRLRRRRR